MRVGRGGGCRRGSDEREDCFQDLFLEVCPNDEESEQVDDDMWRDVILLLNICQVLAE